jgi:hypothetical protein
MVGYEAQGGYAAEFVIGFVDEHGGFAGAFEDSFDAGQGDGGSGGIVGVGYQDCARGGRDCVQELFQREFQGAFEVLIRT